MNIGEVWTYEEYGGEVTIVLITRTRGDGFDGRIFKNSKFSGDVFSFMNKYISGYLGVTEGAFKRKYPEYYV